MGVRSSGVMCLVGSVGCAEGCARRPALRSKDLVAEALGVVGPGGILWVVGDLGATCSEC